MTLLVIKVNYGEGLTEEQWLSAVDNGEDVRALEENARARNTERPPAKRKRDSEDEEEKPKEPKKKKGRTPGEKLPPLDEELVRKMKALVDYIVEYEDTLVTFFLCCIFESLWVCFPIWCLCLL